MLSSYPSKNRAVGGIVENTDILLIFPQTEVQFLINISRTNGVSYYYRYNKLTTQKIS